MAQPFLGHVERHVRRDRLDPEAVAQALGRGMQAGQSGRAHDAPHAAPPGGAGPGPEARAAPAIGSCAQRGDAVNVLQQGQHCRRHRHRTEQAGPPFLEAFDDDDAVLGIDPGGGEVQGFGQAAAGMSEHRAEAARAGIGVDRGRKETIPLRRGEVFTRAAAVMQAHNGSVAGRAARGHTPGTDETELRIVLQEGRQRAKIAEDAQGRRLRTPDSNATKHQNCATLAGLESSDSAWFGRLSFAA